MDTGAEISRTKRTLRSAEKRALRSIGGITLRAQIKTSEIREDLDIQDVVKFARSIKKLWGVMSIVCKIADRQSEHKLKNVHQQDSFLDLP